MKADLEIPNEYEFGITKWYHLKVYKNFKNYYINSHSHNLNFDMVNYFAFKFCRIISSDYSVLLSFMLLIIKNFSI